jgi:hypothetical protein
MLPVCGKLMGKGTRVSVSYCSASYPFSTSFSLDRSRGCGFRYQTQAQTTRLLRIHPTQVDGY